jgi:hypothetical protein
MVNERPDVSTSGPFIVKINYVYLSKLKIMNIEIVSENKNYWYYNRKGLVCKVIKETDNQYIVKVWLNKNYMNVKFINSLNNADSKLLFYYIFNLDRLLSYNTMPVIQSELSYLIIKIIKFSFNSYYRPYSNYMIRKFDYMLINEIPYKDESIKIICIYFKYRKKTKRMFTLLYDLIKVTCIIDSIQSKQNV